VEEVFLKEVLEHPDDEVVRLAYADWLLERGDPAGAARGEFIQVQCSLASRGRTVPAALKAREQALLAAYRDAWTAPLKKKIVLSCEFRRGFVERVVMESSAFLRKAEQLFALAPVQEVRLTTGWSKALADSPWLAKLRGLDLQRQNIGDEGLRLLLGSPHLTRLTTLDLSYNRLTDEGALELARSPYLARITTLHLAYNRLSMRGVGALYESPHWRGERTLTLTGNTRIDARAVQFLAQSLAGNPDAGLLRATLQLSSRQQREYTNREVRDLARRAAADPAQAAGVLGEGVRGSRRKVRSAAAQMLARLGPAAAPSLPFLVQRLYERNESVKDHVAPALARLLPELPPEVQGWLCVLANPLLPARGNLRAALDSPRLPADVRQEFARICARRIAWRRQIAAGGKGPRPDPATVADDPTSIWEAVEQVTTLAGQHAARHKVGDLAATTAGKARDKEHAWLLARLCELLQAAPPAPPALGRKGNR
jgi:uncharacterized protein (TIGR02996 family)